MAPRLDRAATPHRRLRSRSAFVQKLAASCGALLLSIAPLGTVRPAHAQTSGLTLAWQDCRAPIGNGAANQTFGCGVTFVEFPLFPTLRLTAAVDSVVAVELVLDAGVAGESLPAWWDMAPGGCRAIPSPWVASLATTSSCLDPWASNATAASAGWQGLPGLLGLARGRLRVVVAALPGQTLSLPADQPLALARVALRTDNPLACSGCATPACLVFNSVVIRRLPGSVPEDVFVSAEEVAGSARVQWQGGAGVDCQAVPARRSTWSAVKSLYR